MLARKRKPARLPGDGSADQRELRTPPARRRQRLAFLCFVALFALAMTNWLQLRMGAKGKQKSLAPEEAERLRTWFLKELIPLEAPPPGTQKAEL